MGMELSPAYRGQAALSIDVTTIVVFIADIQSQISRIIVDHQLFPESTEIHRNLASHLVFALVTRRSVNCQLA